MDGGTAVVEALIAQGVDTAFTVTGESFLHVLEALRRRRDAVRLVPTRHEGGAVFAAEAFGKLTGRPAAVLVSRGPGASNAAIGVHTAMQDSTPLILFIGQVRNRSKGKESFQEIDHHSMFASLAKAVLEPADAAAIAETTAAAVALSVAGRPGPVVVALPRDLTEADAGEVAIPARRPRAPVEPDPAAIAEAAALIAGARRPLVIGGELVGQQGAHAGLADFADAAGTPLMAAYRRQDMIDNEHPAYTGHLEINRVAFQKEAFEAADVVIAVGSRLDGITSEDGALLRTDQKLILIHPDEAVLARIDAAVGMRSDMAPALDALVAALPEAPADRVAWRDALHADYLAFSQAGNAASEGAVDLAQVVAEVGRAAPEDAVVLTDGGSFARWVHRYHRFRRPNTQAGPMSGAMGYGVPGAIGACLAWPKAPAIAFVGDGGFMMTGQEVATAVEQAIPIKVIVCDNAAHGSILQGQVNAFGADADYATALRSPDFAAVARAYGAAAWRVERTDDFAAAFQEALAHDGPALIHLLTDRRDIAPFSAGKDAV